MIRGEVPIPDPRSVEAFNVSRPNLDAIRASHEERARNLGLLAGAEEEIIEQLLAKRIVGASNLAIMAKTTIPKSTRPSAHCITRFSELSGPTSHNRVGRFEQDIRLAFAVGAVADATTVAATYGVGVTERFDRALESIADPLIPDDARIALGSFLVDRTAHAPKEA